MSFRDSLRHAFFIASPAAFEPTREQRLLADRFASLTHQRRLRAPTLLLLDTMLPLHGVLAQALHFLRPICGLWGVDLGGDELASLVEQPGGLEYLLRRLESVDLATADQECSRASSVAESAGCATAANGAVRFPNAVTSFPPQAGD